MLTFLLDALPWLALAAALGYLVGHAVCHSRCDRLLEAVEDGRVELARREAAIDELASALGDARQRSADFARHADRLGAQYLLQQAGGAPGAGLPG